ncbi:hypothetical protein ACFFX1_15510 [Dactylosporangium sucinum]|uniref:Uncharacterized protein n=1 Tax=Dactylosporangium sucinum TaxID=1424081 RepID=A0A917WXT9_9ACTN|nr:hypothetical protein [Dactylosporangium sucinum]GGM38590.1 hypothetical protein GCM10007977_045080 [Dactylosporangium sucinum]
MAFLVEMPDGGFLEVEERDDVTPDEVLGVLGAAPLEGTGLITFGAVVRTGLAEAEQDDFADWLFDRVVMFAELGGERDGWERRDDGTWQIAAFRGEALG